jgi:serine/threonine protein kinase
MGVEAVTFQVRLEMQAARLKAWGLELDLESLASSRPNKLTEDGDLAVKYVATVYAILDSLKNLETEFLVLGSATYLPITAAASISRMSHMADADSSERQQLSKKIDEMKNQAATSERLRWALEDGRASKALDLLKSMIDDLYSFFPPPTNDPVVTVVLNASLPSVDVEHLNAISTGANGDPLLQGLAYLKSSRLQLQARANALDGVKVNKKFSCFNAFGAEDQRNNRVLGTFEKDDVLVEWKTAEFTNVTQDASLSYRIMLEQRIKNIARLLKSEQKPEDLRTLSCLGVIRREDYTDTQVDYGLTFKVPSRHLQSLASMIHSANKSMLLDDRFATAHVITRAVLFLHLAGWLHKGIRSDNILFFADEYAKINPAHPYLVGFEYSRECERQSQTEDMADDLEWNLYRHPAMQGLPQEPSEPGKTDKEHKPQRPPFGPQHDIYSLGIVLLELGLLQPALDILRRARSDLEYGPHSALNFQRWILGKEVPRLGPQMGRAYRDATALCISGDFVIREDANLEQAFYVDVVRPLSSCRV